MFSVYHYTTLEKQKEEEEQEAQDSMKKREKWVQSLSDSLLRKLLGFEKGG